MFRGLYLATKPADPIRMTQSSRDAPDIVVLPPVLFAGTVATGLAIHYFVWPARVLPPGAGRAIAVALIIIAAIIAWSAHTEMRKVGTNILPTQPTLAIATGGSFRFTRNPLYLSAICVYLAASLWVNSAGMLGLTLPMVAVLHRGVVLPEERYLSAKFGEAYDQYRARVRRWI